MINREGRLITNRFLKWGIVILVVLIAASALLSIMIGVKHLIEPPPQPIKICVIVSSQEITAREGDCP